MPELAGDDMRGGHNDGGHRQAMRSARAAAERILNQAMRAHDPGFHGSFKFTATAGKIVSRQVVESELPDDS